LLNNPGFNLTFSGNQRIRTKSFDGGYTGKDSLCPAALIDKSLCEIFA